MYNKQQKTMKIHGSIDKKGATSSTENNNYYKNQLLFWMTEDNNNGIWQTVGNKNYKGNYWK